MTQPLVMNKLVLERDVHAFQFEILKASVSAVLDEQFDQTSRVYNQIVVDEDPISLLDIFT